jgi:hypothetical protein
MSGLGDQVVTRCASCGYAVTARRYAVPRDCPICRASLDPESAPTPRDDAETGAQPDEEITQETASTYASESTESESAPAPPPSIRDEPGAREARASSQPPSGEVTNATPQAAVTSPLGSVTLPMYEPDSRGTSRESRDSSSSVARETVSYTPLDAGELWSEFGGAEPTRAESKAQTESKAQAESKKETELKTGAAPPPTQSAPPPTQSAPSFPQSSPLGLSGAPAATPPFTTMSSAPARVQPIQAQAVRGAFEAGVAVKVLGRYGDGYRAARMAVVMGTLIKVLGAPLGLLAGFGVYAAAGALGQGPRGVGLLLALFFGVGTFALFFALGVSASALGRLKRAALDSAVNTSPFLTNEERAELMSMR